MKNLLIFLFGAVVGAGGTFLWFHKDIKNELEKEKKSGSESDSEPPFTVSEGDNQAENGAKIVAANEDYAPEKQAKIPYHTLFQGSENGSEGMFSDPRESGIFTQIREDEDPEGGFVENENSDRGVFEIDKDDFMADDGYAQERLIYYRGDRIMATEDGTIVTNPFILVGGDWEKYVGHYADHTAFVRNPRLVMDYEIYAEDGLYSDEYGPPEGYREG